VSILNLETSPDTNSAAAAPAPAIQPAVSHPVGERVIKAGVAVLAANLVIKLVGFFIKRVIANGYGLPISDAFSVVNNTVLGTAFSIGENCLGPAYMPVFAGAREKEGEARALRFTSVLFNAQLVLLLVITAALILFPAPVIDLFTQWDVDVNVMTRNGKVQGELLRVDSSVLIVNSGGNEIRVPAKDIQSSDLPERDLFNWKKLKTPPAVRLQTSGGVVQGTLTGAEFTYAVRTSQGEVVLSPADVSGSDALPDPGVVYDKNQRRDLARAMLPYLAPALIGMSLASLTYWVLVAYKRFFFAAFGDALLRFSILGGAAVGAVLGASREQGSWRYIVIGAVLGGTLKLLLHIFVIGRQRLRMYTPSLNLKDAYLRDFCLLVLPLLTGIVVSQWRDGVVRNVLTAAAGLPTYYDMGRGVVDSVGFVIPLALSIALLPFFCDMVAREDRERLGRLLTQTIRVLVWFFVPLGVVMAVSAQPACMAAYGGKVITPVQAELVALVMQLFCIQLPFLATEMMVNQAFFSSRRMVAPTTAGIVLSLVGSAVAYGAVTYGGVKSPTGILLVVCITLVALRAIKCVILVALLKSTVPVLPAAQTLGYALRVLLAGGAAAAAGLAVRWAYHHPLSFIAKKFQGGELKVIAGNLLEVALIAVAGAVVYLALSLLLRMEEPGLCWRWTKDKLRGRGNK
jgi:peptidoglycan biosynthesis protein MviN/MurJ (putative lipid II flippase)